MQEGAWKGIRGGAVAGLVTAEWEEFAPVSYGREGEKHWIDVVLCKFYSLSLSQY